MPSDDKKRDLSPEPYTTPKKKMGEHFDLAANKPNNPKHEDIPESYNVTYDYCGNDDE